MIRGFLVDAEEVYLNGLAALLQTRPGMQVETLLVDRDSPPHRSRSPFDIVLMGMSVDRAEDLLELAKGCGDAKKLAILSDGCAGHMHSILSAGFDSYVRRSCTCQTLIRAVDSTLAGGRFVEEAVGSWLLGSHEDRWSRFRLTARERDVVALVVRGDTSGEIAARLFISPRTVSFHLQNIYKKVGVRSRDDLLRRA